jgi:signal transduction histidine kinase
VTSVWQDAPATIVLGVVLVAVSARQHLQAIGRTRRAHVPALEASLALGIALTVEAAIRMTLPTSTGNEPLLLAYEAVLVAIAGGLCLGLVFAPWERVEIADFIVEVGEERSGTLRAELSRALGDPSLDISYWLAERQAFVDAEGRTVDLPEPAAQKAVTMIERDGERIAALVHDPAVLEDQGLVEAVSVAAQLAASNARLQAEVRARLDELLTSRRRIVEAADEERWRLAGRLHQGAERHLRELAEKLHSAFGSSRGDSTRERIQQAEAQLAQTLDELRELAQGLHPRVLGEVGLEGALAAVVQRASVPAEISVAVGKLPDPVEAAVYFVCSEAIANVIKYASASHVRISVSAERDRVTAAVEDDGIGGVELGRGSGLRGLRDRVEALGGTLGVRSPRGGGTSVVAEIPLQTAMAARR